MYPAHPTIEPLEARIAPSTLVFVNSKTATYTDVDGDEVTVKFSKGILSNTNVANVLVTTPIDATHDQLQVINLTAAGLAASAAGTKITVAVALKPPGDGFANVGYINATGVDLNTVTVRGDLGAIDAGDTKTKTPGVKSLTVQSLGVLGTSSGAPDLNSDIVGALSKLTVKGTFIGAILDVTGGKDGKIGSASVGVNFVGGTGTRSGSIHTTGDLGKVKIGGDLNGGSGTEAGSILSDGKIGSVSIGGKLLGGFVLPGFGAGSIHSKGDLGKVTIGSDVFGGFGDSCGAILSDAKIASVQIGGTLQGGILLIGMGTPRDGFIGSGGDMGKIMIRGDMAGTFIPFAGSIMSGGKIASVTVGGKIVGDADHSGSILAAGDIGAVTVGGDIFGGREEAAGSIMTNGDIKNVKIGGSLAGGRGDSTGVIIGANLGSISIGGGLAGSGSAGAASFAGSGAIMATTIKSLVIGGDLSGGSATNEALERTGYVSATTIQALTIGGSLYGGSLSGSGSVIDSGTIVADHIDKISIGASLNAGSLGSMSSGTLIRAGSICVTHDIGSLTIRGSVLGSADSGGGQVPAVISAVGQVNPSPTKDLAIGSLTIGGDVFLANILAGYNPTQAPVNGGAQIGKVAVTGNWTSSNLVAGAMNAASSNQDFGDSNDAAIAGGSSATIAKIASISVGGIIFGSQPANDHFGFVAHQIGSFAIGGTKIPLQASPSSLDLSSSGDVSIHQI